MSFLKCCIKQYEYYPVPGGWGFIYELKGQRFHIKNGNPQKIVDVLTRILRNNDAYESDQQVWDICNQEWARRAPAGRVHKEFLDRFAAEGPPIGVASAPAGPRTDHWKMDPAYYGPILWHWLHMFGHHFNKPAWDSAIARVGVMLNPDLSPDSGCITCSQEWRAICTFLPPEIVTNEAQAAKWSFDAHNHVNKKLGKRIRGWAECAKTYGWKVAL